MRWIFFGSPPFATPVIEHLLGGPRPPVAVVTPPDRPRGRGRHVLSSPVAELTHVTNVELLQPQTVRDASFIERVAAFDADVFLVVSYGELLRQEFLDLPKDVCLNVHPSLLPRWRGATPIPAALRSGDAETGVTIQKVVLALDAGDVLVQTHEPILPGETAGELAARLAAVSGPLCDIALERVAGGNARYVPQDPAGVTMCKRLTKESGAFDWSLAAAELERHVRAMNPWPGARTTLADGRGLAVWRCHPLPTSRPEGAAPGELVRTEGRLVVACGTGLLELDDVQVEGKRPMDAGAFLRGNRLQAGEFLGASADASD